MIVLSLLRHLAHSYIDREVNPTVAEPAPGSVVYCDLVTGYAEHSGIYVGQDRIAHLNRHGVIETVNPAQFLDDTTAMSIYVSCQDAQPVGSQTACHRALAHLGRRCDYHLLFNNCHQFSVGCLTGEFDNPCNFLTLLKNTAHDTLGTSHWRVWRFAEGEADTQQSVNW